MKETIQISPTLIVEHQGIIIWIKQPFETVLINKSEAIKLAETILSIYGLNVA